MGLSIDASKNYLIWGNVETITYGSTIRSGTTLTVPSPNQFNLANVKRRAPTQRELAASNGAYTGQDLVWLIPNAIYPAGIMTPKPGDRITDGFGIVWTVLERAWNALKSTWRLMSRNLALAFQLYDLIDVQRPGVTYDVAGAAVRAWPDDSTPAGTIPYKGIAAKVQLLTQETQETLGVFGMKGTYAVYIGQDVMIQKMDRVAWYPTGGAVTYLDILTQHNPQRIDELPVLDCVQQP